MNEVGKEYGAALFALACEQNAAEQYADELTLVEQTLAQSPEYVTLLLCPGVAKQERIDLLAKTFGAQVSRTVLSFLQLMCEKSRLSCFDKAVQEYRALLAQSLRTVSAKVTSAAELTPAQKQRLEKALEQKFARRIKAEYEIDEQLLGGLVVEADGKTLDGSLRHRLYEIKEVMKS